MTLSNDMPGNQRPPLAVRETPSSAAAVTCPACHGQLTHLGDLPGRLRGPALRIWRCYSCDEVVSEARG